MGETLQFLPPTTMVLLRICKKLASYQGQVQLLALLWHAQSWYYQLVQWCPTLIPLGPQVVPIASGPSQSSLCLPCVEFLQRVLADSFGECRSADMVQGIKSSSLHQYQSCWGDAFQKYIVCSQLTEIGKDMIFQYLSYLFQVKHRAPATVASCLAVLADPIHNGFGIRLDTMHYHWFDAASSCSVLGLILTGHFGPSIKFSNF